MYDWNRYPKFDWHFWLTASRWFWLTTSFFSFREFLPKWWCTRFYPAWSRDYFKLVHALLQIENKTEILKLGNVSMTGHHTTWKSSVEAKQYHIRNSSVGGETIYHNNCFLFQKCTSYQVLSSLFMFETEVQLIREKNPTIHVFNKSYWK